MIIYFLLFGQRIPIGPINRYNLINSTNFLDVLFNIEYNIKSIIIILKYLQIKLLI